MDAIKTKDLFDLTHSRAAQMLEKHEYPWTALSEIKETVLAIGSALDPQAYDHPQEDVWIAKTATVYPTATIIGPCVIGENTEVRPGAFLRGSILVGDGCVVGNSTELKNCILFDEVQVPHYNYVGDSILGFKAHMGAGAITSNVKGDKKNIVVHGEANYETGCKKFGAMLGGSVVTEKVFAMPGIGTKLVDAIKQCDMPLIVGSCLLISAMYSLIMLTVDLLYAFVDPRIKAKYTK